MGFAIAKSIYCTILRQIVQEAPVEWSETVYKSDNLHFLPYLDDPYDMTR